MKAYQMLVGSWVSGSGLGAHGDGREASPAAAGLGMCISHKFPGEADAAGPETTR